MKSALDTMITGILFFVLLTVCVAQAIVIHVQEQQINRYAEEVDR